MKSKTEKTPVQTEDQTENSTLNYNDRLDGYGYGEADKEVNHAEGDKGKCETDEEHDPDRFGYWEVDQYSFRDPPIRKQHDSSKDKNS